MNPLRAVWWLVTNVRFAILLLVLLVVVSLVGVLVPQMPANVRGDSFLEEEWIATQEDRFGVLTEPMDALGIFDVFHQRWFALLLAVTVASTGAYVVSRFPGIWQTITRPRKRVPDRYFEMAPHRVSVDATVDAARLAEALEARRYRVETMAEGDATYVFADRFQWAQLGTLLTHAAIIVFMLSAVVSRVDAFSSPLFLAEGGTLPVFPVSDPDQIQVEVTNVHSEFAADGQPLDYRTDMVIYRRGEEAMRCSSTVNSPCSYDGYRFYQAAYFGFGAQVQVRDAATGNVIYDETLALSERAPAPRTSRHRRRSSASGRTRAPHRRRRDAGRRLQRARSSSWRAGERLRSGRRARPTKSSSSSPPAKTPCAPRLSEGQIETSGGLDVSYVGTEGVPSFVVPDFPLPESVGEGASGEALLQMTNVVYGTDETSEGDTDAANVQGDPRLTIIGLEPQPVVLGPGDSATIDGLEYTFEGQREFAGIDVRRDRSDMLVWLGAGATVIGLMITFWVPRRRLWAKITATRLSLAGQAPSHADYTRELADLARAAGADVRNEETDTDD